MKPVLTFVLISSIGLWGKGAYVVAERSGAGKGAYVVAERSGADRASGVGDRASGVGAAKTKHQGLLADQQVTSVNIAPGRILLHLTHERSFLMSVSATVGSTWTEFVATRCSTLRDELIMAYTPLVRLVVGKLGIPPTSLLEADDLISYGTIGLINAIDRFDPTRGVRFEAFATVRIRGAVIDQLRALNWLPRSALTRIRQIESALSTLEQLLGRPAQEEEAAAAEGVSTDRYRQMRREVDITILSLDAPLGLLPQLDGVASLGDLLEDHDLLGPA